MAKLCSGNDRMPAALRALGARRVVVGCRRVAASREEIAAGLRRAGIHPAGAAVVDLLPAGKPDLQCVVGQSAVRLAAATARVVAADLGSSAHAGLVAMAGPVSRRDLFHPWSLSWAMPPAGWAIREFEAAARILVAEALHAAPGRVHGVTIVCSRAVRRVPVGADWLPLEVPSLEQVSAGWPLQILGAGTGVAFTGCDEDACAGRARELDRLCAEVASRAAPGLRRLSTRLGGWGPACEPPLDAALSPARIVLREPEATALALARLGAPPAGGEPAPPWRINSAAIQLGQISVDAARCSACACCVRACPTGAIDMRHQDGSALALSFNAAQCTACGACASACPEHAVTVWRGADSASITAGPSTLAMIADAGRCESCGQPLAGGVAGSAIALRLAASHPEIAARLHGEGRCTDCLLLSPGRPS